jgi:serine/threonine-protein kinase
MTRPSPERWARIENLLDTLIEAPTHQRNALLEQECGQDAELRAEVERLLAACLRAESLYETPPLLIAEAAAAEQADGQRDHVAAGQVIGAYRIVDLLGRGGMGAVYMAERADGAFQRRVALKIVKRGMDTDEIVGRFRRERQILARLEHPNIAGLLDGGITDAGLPYFVMELAPGQPIDQYCDERRLTVDERLRLFLYVCAAVQYAHRNLVVHRDLKPGNILVSAEGVKLLDFGIAKVLHAEDDADTQPATRLHERRLTPEYAAPEQVRGQPTTTATDVYALGVILYELLTGRSPYRIEGSFADIERTVCITDPKPPSSLARRNEVERPASAIAEQRSTTPQSLRQRLAGDLDAIILRALHKEPERRYPSVEALAEDITRHLEGRPVIARPDTQWYRISKFVRRNAVLVGLATSAGIALLGGSVATYLSRQEAVRLAAEADRQRVNAEDSRDFLAGVLLEIDPDQLRKGEFTRDMLISISNRNLQAFANQRDLYPVLANTLGRLSFNQGDTERADSLFREAHRILEPRGPSLELATTLMGLGEVAHRGRRFEEAESRLRQALAIRQSPRQPDPRLVGESLAKLAFVLYTRDDYQRADSLYRQVLLLGNRVDSETRGFALEGLGDLQLGRKDFEGAERLYRQSMEERTRDRPARPPVARMMWGLATALDSLHRPAEALDIHRRALQVLLAHYDTLHRDVALACFSIGDLLMRMDSLAAAESMLTTAARISEAVNPTGFLFTGYAWDVLGRTQERMRKYGDAQASLEKAMAVFRAHFEDTSPRARDDARLRYAIALHWHGMAASRSGDTARAVAELREAWQSLSGGQGDAGSATRSAAELARLFESMGQRDSAAVYRQRSGSGTTGGL